MAKTLLEEEDAYRLLRTAGVPVPASAVASSREEAAEAAADSERERRPGSDFRSC